MLTADCSPNLERTETEEPQNEKKIYMHQRHTSKEFLSTSKELAFKSHGVTVIHKYVSSLGSQLVHVMDKTVNLKKCGTVYQIYFEQCNKEIVGETSRLLEIKMKEHQSRNMSVIYDHYRLEGHQTSFELSPPPPPVLSTQALVLDPVSYPRLAPFLSCACMFLTPNAACASRKKTCILTKSSKLSMPFPALNCFHSFIIAVTPVDFVM